MIAFLPVVILGAPLLLALIDLMVTRSSASDLDYDQGVPAGRYTGVRNELRRGDESSSTVPAWRETRPGEPAVRTETAGRGSDAPVNLS